jgi:hypothetical protein
MRRASRCFRAGDDQARAPARHPPRGCSGAGNRQLGGCARSAEGPRGGAGFIGWDAVPLGRAWDDEGDRGDVRDVWLKNSAEEKAERTPGEATPGARPRSIGSPDAGSRGWRRRGRRAGGMSAQASDWDRSLRQNVRVARVFLCLKAYRERAVQTAKSRSQGATTGWEYRNVGPVPRGGVRDAPGKHVEAAPLTLFRSTPPEFLGYRNDSTA